MGHVASVISVLLQTNVDALLIVTIVLMSILINFWQSFRSQQPPSACARQVTPTATVGHDAEWREIPIRQVVPGDVIRLSAGGRTQFCREFRGVRVDFHGQAGSFSPRRAADSLEIPRQG
jgi:magnesium-transporting ATPase (P-type)